MWARLLSFLKPHEDGGCHRYSSTSHQLSIPSSPPQLRTKRASCPLPLIIFTPAFLSSKCRRHHLLLPPPSSASKAPVKTRDQKEAVRSRNSSHLEMIRGFLFPDTSSGGTSVLEHECKKPREGFTAGWRLLFFPETRANPGRRRGKKERNKAI